MSNKQHFETRLKSYDNTYKDLFVRNQNNPIISGGLAVSGQHSINPAVKLYQNKVLLLVRVEDRRGYTYTTGECWFATFTQINYKISDAKAKDVPRV